MDEHESQNRFTALVSGTAAEHIKPGLLKRQNQSLPDKELSPASFGPQSRQILAGYANHGELQDEPASRRVDPVRRHGFRELVAASVNPFGPVVSSRAALDHSGMQIENEAHISSDSTVPRHRTGIPKVAHPSGSKAHRTSYGPLRSSKSLKQRFGNADEFASSGAFTRLSLRVSSIIISRRPSGTTGSPCGSWICPVPRAI